MKTIHRVSAVVGAVLAFALAASAPASALAARSARQTFLLYGAGSTFHHPISVFAAGPIFGVGSFEIVDERSGEHGEDFTAQLVFPGRGTVAMEVRGRSAITFDPVACVGSQTSSFRWTITGGTEEFENAGGSGTGSYNARFVVERGPSGCLENDASVSVFVARLTGTASLSAAQAA